MYGKEENLDPRDMQLEKHLEYNSLLNDVSINDDDDDDDDDSDHADDVHSDGKIMHVDDGQSR